MQFFTVTGGVCSVGGNTFAVAIEIAWQQPGSREMLRKEHAEVFRTARESGFWAAYDRGVDAVTSAVKIYATEAERGEVKHHIAAPERGGEDIGDAWFAAVPAGVDLRDAAGKVRGAHGVEDGWQLAPFQSGELRMWTEEVIEGGPRISRWTHGIVMHREKGNIRVIRSYISKCSEVGQVIRDIRAGKACLWHLLHDGITKSNPLVDELLGAVVVVSEVAEGVWLVADLEGREARAKDAMSGLGFSDCIGFGSEPEIEPIEAGPVCGIEEGAKIAQCELRGDGALFCSVACIRAKDYERRRPRRRVRGVSGVVGRAAAKAKYAVRGEFAEELDKAAIPVGEEAGIGQLCGFVTESGEIYRHGVRCGVFIYTERAGDARERLVCGLQGPCAKTGGCRSRGRKREKTAAREKDWLDVARGTNHLRKPPEVSASINAPGTS